MQFNTSNNDEHETNIDGINSEDMLKGIIGKVCSYSEYNHICHFTISINNMDPHIVFVSFLLDNFDVEHTRNKRNLTWIKQ